MVRLKPTHLKSVKDNFHTIGQTPDFSWKLTPRQQHHLLPVSFPPQECSQEEKSEGAKLLRGCQAIIYKPALAATLTSACLPGELGHVITANCGGCQGNLPTVCKRAVHTP
jgi:hypothetical protein